MDLDKFFNNMRRGKQFEYNSESIMRLLVYSRVLYPHSKKQTLEIKDKYFSGDCYSNARGRKIHKASADIRK